MNETVKIAEAKAHFSELVARAEAGEEIFISRGNKPVARIVPLGPKAPRTPGIAAHWKDDPAYAELITAVTEPLSPEDQAAAESDDTRRIFIGEAERILELSEAIVEHWRESTYDPRFVTELQRELHTLKGGARTAGLTAGGDLSHAMESVFESVTEQRVDSGERLRGLVRHAADALAQDIDWLGRGSLPAAHPAMIDRLEAAARGREWEDIEAFETAVEAEAATPPMTAELGVAEALAAAPGPAYEEQSQEMDAGSALDDEASADSGLLTDSQLIPDSELLVESSLFAAGRPEVVETAIRVNQQMLDVMTAGASGKI